MSPTQLSLRWFRANGWLVDVCERRYGGKSHDLFGMLDLVAVRPGQTAGVQVTSAGNVSARMHKIGSVENLDSLLALKAAGWVIVVHGWRKSTRDGRACTHGRACLVCNWTLHRNEQL